MNTKFQNRILAATAAALVLVTAVAVAFAIGVLFSGAQLTRSEVDNNPAVRFGSIWQTSASLFGIGVFELLLIAAFLLTVVLAWVLFFILRSNRNSKSLSVTDKNAHDELRKRKKKEVRLADARKHFGESNKLVKEIIEGTTDLISAIDKDYRLISFNSPYEKDSKRLFDIDIEIGINMIEALGDFPEQRDKSKQLWDRALGGEQFTAYEDYFDSSGESSFYEVTYYPLKNDDGEIVGASHIVRNVTERRLAEQALKQERDFVSTIVEASKLLVVVCDREGRIIKFNRECEKTSGYKFEEIKGRVFWNVLIPPEEAPAIKRGYRGIKADSQSPNHTNHWITKDETLRLVSWRSAVIKDDRGIEYIVGTGIDITEKIEFKETQDRILDILETSSDFIGISDMTGNINYLNPAGRKMLGIDQEFNASEMKMVNAYPKWAGDIIQSEGIPTAIKRGSWVGETALKTAQAREIPVSQLILAHKNEQGEVAYLSTVARDISKQKRLETELSSTRDAALETAKLKSEFLANMSHEIRTPMNGIIGLAELLLSTKLDKEQKDYVESVQSSGEILLTIVNDILDFSKIEAGKFHMENVSFDLRETLESILDLFAEPAQRKGIEIALLIQKNVPDSLFGDPRRLRQVLTNLVANAVKFTDNGEIVIRVGKNDAEVDSNTAQLRFSVTDSGIGIADNVQRNLFDAFTQADTSITRKYGGTGLGLAISKQLVEMMNGEIGVKSEVGQGARFWFTAEFEVEEDSGYSNPYESELKDLRVLVVERNDTIRGVVMQQLKSMGTICDESPTTGDALNLLKTAAENREPFDAVVIDSGLAKIGGKSLSEMIRELPQLRKTKVLLMASINDHELVKQAKKNGINSYIFKPIRESELMGHLSDLSPRNQRGVARGAGESARHDAVPVLLKEEGKLSEPGQISQKILIAEDNLVNQKVIVNQIKSFGVEADVANNGKEVLELLEKNKYALILMDCQMPLLNGLEASEEIRKIEVGTDKRIPIIAVTALAIEGDRERCLAAGMDDYITKPTKLNEIEQIVTKWIGTESDSTVESERTATPVDSEEEHIDKRLRDLTNSCGEDVTLECIELFEEDIERSILRLKDAFEESDLDRLDKEAHKLKGSAANMGAERLPKICQKLMLASRENRTSDIENLVSLVFEEYESLKPIYQKQREMYMELQTELQPTN